MNRCILHRLSAMDHHSISDINSDMTCAYGIIGSFEKNDVTGLCFLWRNIGTDLTDSLGSKPSIVPAISAVVDYPAHKSGAVKSSRHAATTDIRCIQMLFRFRYHPGKPLITERFRGNSVSVSSVSRQTVQIKKIVPVSEGTIVQTVANLLIICQPVPKDCIRVMICEGYTVAVDRLRCVVTSISWEPLSSAR